MRLKRPAILISACAAFLLTTGTGSGQNSGARTTPVTVEGCPVPGVEGGCLVIKGKDGKFWEIGSANPRPDVGAHAISLTGQVSASPSHCMQGTRLDHIQWHYTDRQCAQTPAPR